MAREIEDYVTCSRMPNSPTRFDELKVSFEEHKERRINDLKEDKEAFTGFKETLKLNTSDAEEVFNSAVNSGMLVSKYIKEFNGIPITNFLQGKRDLFADLSLLRTKCYWDGIYFGIYFEASITNESYAGTLWTCYIDMNFELLKKYKLEGR